MKRRLVAGTINRWLDTDEWRNYHLDIEPRIIWDGEIEMGVMPDFVMDLGSGSLADFRDQTFDEIRCHHVLEHIPFERAMVALDGFHRILRDDGVLDIEVPDAARLSEALLSGAIDHGEADQWFLGEQLKHHTPGDSHRSIWTPERLGVALTLSGFTFGDRETTGLALRYLATKTKPQPKT